MSEEYIAGMGRRLKIGRDALQLAVNRLEFLALKFEPNTPERMDCDEWAEEAKEAKRKME